MGGFWASTNRPVEVIDPATPADRPPSGAWWLMLRSIDRWWWLTIPVIVAAAGAMALGPWTDQPSELQGWDAERFQEIADRRVPAWSATPVEYPPGSVVVFDTIAADTVVGTNRALVWLAVAATAVTAAALWRGASPLAGRAVLVLGLPLVAIGLVRLDPLVTAVATVAAMVLLVDRRLGREARPEQGPQFRRGAAVLVFAVVAGVGAMIKLWPALLVAGALAAGRRSAAVAAVLATGAMGLAWLVVVGDGVEPVRQVLALRGATGWHVESVPGALVALFGDEAARLELNAFRIGELQPAIVTAGRIIAIGCMGGLVLAAVRNPDPAPERHRLGLTMLGATAALVVTAPLLSPQFIIWLTPWTALALADTPNRAGRVAVVLTAASALLTGVALTVFTPDQLADTAPAAVITARNIALAAVPVACLLALQGPAGYSGPADGGVERPLGHGSAGPRA